jgi:hypothetical protein
MTFVMIAPAGPALENIVSALKTFKVEQMYLITPMKYRKDVQEKRALFEKKGIDVKTIELGSNYWEDFFRITKETVELHPNNEYVMHTTTGDCYLRMVATTAAFLNSIKALCYDNQETKLLPLFNFTYHDTITDKKRHILTVLEEDITCCRSFEELAQKTGMSLPLISYHINGNLKSKGLKTLGLVETHEDGGRINVNLTQQGVMLLKGYIKEKEEEK